MTETLRIHKKQIQQLAGTSEECFGELKMEINNKIKEDLQIQVIETNHKAIYFDNKHFDNLTQQNNSKIEKGQQIKCNYDKIILKLQQDEQINKSSNFFNDPQFPAGIISLMGDSTEESKELLVKKRWDNIIWQRPIDFLSDMNSLFGENGIQILKTVIYSVLQPVQQRNQISLCVNGIWREVIIDDLFPICNETGRVLFEGQSSQPLWILLVEKAWAKINGGFIYLDMGMTRETLHDLTGAPCDNYFLESEYEKDIWDIIKEGIQKGQCITCGTKSISGNDHQDLRFSDHILNKMGLVSSHAYSLLGAYTLSDQQKTKIIKLRNPWGNDKWNGKYSRYDQDTWRKIDKQFKKIIGYQKYEHDKGILYMEFSDFYQNFVDLQICMINDNYKYNSYKSKQETNKSYFYKIKITETGQYFFTVNQQSYSKKNHSNLNFNQAGANHSEYSQVTLVLARWDPKHRRYVYIDGNQDNYREVYTKQIKNQNLKQGEYVLYVKVNWTNDRESDKIVISSYGVSDVTINPLKPIKHFIRSALLYHAMFQSSNKKCLHQYKKEHFWICMNQMTEGYIYIAAWNNVKELSDTDKVFAHIKSKSEQKQDFYNQQQEEQQFNSDSNNNKITLNDIDSNQQQPKVNTFNSRFIIKNMNGLKLKKPFKDNVINFRLKPGQADIALIRCKDLELIESFDVEQQFII